MREERWINRFFYSWQNSLYYNPIDTHYHPQKNNYADFLPEPAKKQLVRSGIWWGVNLNPEIPPQGWKIHISATADNAERILRLASAYLTAHRITFKVALDINILELLNSKATSRGSSGKFMTIYPKDNAEFLRVIDDLAGMLKGEKGPYILSDCRYKDVECLYFRYGQFVHMYATDVMGRRRPVMRAPDGTVIPDNRDPFFHVPENVEWPFHDWTPDAEDEAEETVLQGRYRITDVISFSNSGGVYLAEDLTTSRTVIVKECRPHTNFNPRHKYDAAVLQAREWQFLNVMARTGVTPKPVDFFEEWEHQFLVEEYVEGIDIRGIILPKNPLLMLKPRRAHSVHYLRLFLKVFKSFTRALQAFHDKGVVLGDLNAKNFLINKYSHRVTIIDLEAARYLDGHARPGGAEMDQTVDLYMPGFRSVERRDAQYTEKDDYYSLACIMAYFIYPVAVMTYLRKDTFDLYERIIRDLGWPPEIHAFLSDLAALKLDLPAIRAFLARGDELLQKVQEPLSGHGGQPALLDVQPGRGRRLTPEFTRELNRMQNSVATFMADSADLNRNSLFPVDPLAHVTNPLSLCFWAAGAMQAFQQADHTLIPEWRAWFLKQVGGVTTEDFPPGLLSGLSGLAWTLLDMGETEEAARLLTMATEHPALNDDYSYYYGLAGIGMTHLKFHRRTGEAAYLKKARILGQQLLDTARQDQSGLYWENSFTADRPFTGLGFGQSGVALYLLRLSQVTGEDHWRQAGEQALAWDLAQGVRQPHGSVTFEHDGTLLPYVEVGGAGIVKVLLRYGRLKEALPIARGLEYSYYVLPGYLFGVSGIIDTMLDLYRFTGQERYLSLASRQLDTLKRLYLFPPAESSNFAALQPGIRGLAVVGEGLLRTTCDLATGSAGVLRMLNRFRHLSGDDLMLDDLD